VISVKNRIDILEKRCEKTDGRRKIDNEGYRSELKELKTLLKNLQSNVNLIIRKYGDIELEKKGFSKPNPALLDEILKKGTASSGSSNERLGPAVSSAHPTTNQKALSIWTDYIGNRIAELDYELDPKLQASGKNNKWQFSNEYATTVNELRRYRKEESSTASYTDEYSN